MKTVSQSAGLTATPASSYRHLQPAITGLPQKKMQLQKRPFSGPQLPASEAALLRATSLAFFSEAHHLASLDIVIL
jgi:hypothetical protein